MTCASSFRSIVEPNAFERSKRLVKRSIARSIPTVFRSARSGRPEEGAVRLGLRGAPARRPAAGLREVLAERQLGERLGFLETSRFLLLFRHRRGARRTRPPPRGPRTSRRRSGAASSRAACGG